MTDWSQIVKQHGSAVWKTAWRLLGNEADAADCFQNAFMAAVELSRTQPVRNVSALLRRLATVKALDRLRQRYRLGDRHVPLDDSVVPADPTDEPPRRAQASELAQDLRDALAELDQRHASVFCLTCLEGLSYKQVAGQLGMTVSNVGVILNRTRAQLRQRLRVHAPSDTAPQSDREIRT